ncbi:Multiple epidermal growth factor-like domains protein 6 [Merluccius polli]|uniref:Multiple epidermal growth factor-like domains protein 6 n=1 Tax=Merluccius polli TaxID=89951 RepID=A0AA47NRG9_MERPO|nr:Multiple epidermal growth factor-like domains protein 6 [Merluccius polli]
MLIFLIGLLSNQATHGGTNCRVMTFDPCVFAACPQGFYGLDCQETCVCLNGGRCDHASGACSCLAGWIGPHCNRSESLAFACKRARTSFTLRSRRGGRACSGVGPRCALAVARPHQRRP